LPFGHFFSDPYDEVILKQLILILALILLCNLLLIALKLRYFSFLSFAILILGFINHGKLSSKKTPPPPKKKKQVLLYNL